MYFKGVLNCLVMHYPVVQPKRVSRLLLSLGYGFTRLQVFCAVKCLAELGKLVAIKEYKLVWIEKYNFSFGIILIAST